MSFYRWCMRHGAAILFAIALLILAAGLIAPISSLLAMTRGMASDLYSRPSVGLAETAQLFLAAFTMPILPFAAALVIDRLDRRMPAKDENRETFE
ncbi:MAG TPA: hypothetical protein VGO55_00265 [Allosphingosinicella sp.]|jgi:hypothetical protein|nr:hypothetical protein [Allosphingosinicella sp.]